MYLPKTKYKVEITAGKYVDEEGNKYGGPTIITYVGDAYIGSDINDIKGKLVPVSSISSTKNIEKEVVPVKRVPSEEDYSKGYIERYFRQNVNSRKIIEISSEDYYKRNKADKNYKYSKCTWLISGTLNDYYKGQVKFKGVKSKNQETITLMEETLPGIVSSKVLWDPEQFFRKN